MAREVSTTTVGEDTQPCDLAWTAYLTGRQSAERFLKDVQRHLASAKAKALTDSNSAVKAEAQLLGPSEMDQFIAAFKGKPERGLQRLLALLQASNRTGDEEIRRVVVDLGEAAIRAFSAVTLPELLDRSNYMEAVSSWLESSRKHLLKQADLNLLLVLVHVGSHHRLLESSEIWRLLRIGLSKPASRSSKSTDTTPPAPTLETVLLSSSEPDGIVHDLLEYYDHSLAATTELENQVKELGSRMEALTSHRDALRSRVETLDSENAALQMQCDETSAAVEQLEAQLTSTRAAYMHMLDDMRGHTLGSLEGPLSRWLQTGLDAARMSPPRSSVIEERLEEALKLIEREVEWLRRSA